MKLLFLLPVLVSAQHIANLRQLTNGGQNPEAYWAPDGKRAFENGVAPRGWD
jgi:hypothetical protein